MPPAVNAPAPVNAAIPAGGGNHVGRMFASPGEKKEEDENAHEPPPYPSSSNVMLMSTAVASTAGVQSAAAAVNSNHSSVQLSHNSMSMQQPQSQPHGRTQQRY
jgi:hypothetical protein